jgi:hypothetical protein
VVDRTLKYFIFSYVLVTTEVNSAIDICIHSFFSIKKFVSFQNCRRYKSGHFLLEDPVASATYFDLEEHHYEMSGVLNKMLEKHCEQNKCRTELPQGSTIFRSLFKQRVAMLTCELWKKFI